MKVAVVSPYSLDRPGGVQDQTIQISSRLAASGIESWVVGPGRTGPPGAKLLGPALSVPINRSRAPIAWRPGVIKRLQQAVAGADVVHLHEPFVPVVGWGVLADRKQVTVGTFHADPSGLVRRGYRLLAPALQKPAARLRSVTAVSETAASAVRPFTGAVRIIPNGIDTTAYGGTAVPNRVAFLGRDEPRKGLDVILGAWPQIQDAVPDARLDVLGSRRPDAVEGVVFHGRVSEDEKRRLLGEAQVFVAPNLGGESFGITLVEGMASGCAVVASDIAAFKSVGENAAEFFPVGDAAGLATTVVGLLKDPTRLEGCIQDGRARSEVFDWTTVLPSYIDIYRAALGGI